jgi:hypothetical protein
MGARAASSHTGALAGNDKIYEDVLKQSGVIRARSLRDLLEFARAIPVLPTPKGENVIIITGAGSSGVVEQDRIVGLPLQGRQVTDLIVLAGAAVNTGNVSAFRGMPGTVAISVAGGLRVGVSYLLDGAMHNNTYDNQNLPLPFPDALQEFSVATGGLSADHGVHAVASVNAVTKSGSNRFSGNAFEFLRDKRFNAVAAFAPIGADGKKVDDALNRNQFGGTLGGPLLRDKLFFFGGYQGTRTIERPSSNIAFVPTPAMIAGDFTAFASAACNGGRPVALDVPPNAWKA